MRAGHGGEGSAVACRRRQGDVVAGSMLGRACELPVAPVNRMGETRRRQALPTVLAMVESKRLRWRSGRGAVWSNGGPPVAFVYLNCECGVFRGMAELVRVLTVPYSRWCVRVTLAVAVLWPRQACSVGACAGAVLWCACAQAQRVRVVCVV
jgi:hypothetical protein